MTMRFKILAGLYLVMMLVAHDSGYSLAGGIGDVFVGLMSLLVLAVIALWPTTQAGDNADRAMAGSGWADRIEFEKPARE